MWTLRTIIAVAVVVVSMGTVANSHAQVDVSELIPPEILPPRYAEVDLAYFESNFGASFTGNDVAPLVVGPRDPSGSYPLVRIDLSTGSLSLHSAGSIKPTTFRRLPRLTETVTNMVDFVNTDPDLLGVDWSLSTHGQAVLADVTTSSGEKLKLQGVWLKVTVSRQDNGYTDSTTFFIPEMAEATAGNQSLAMGPPSENLDDYLTVVDCQGLGLTPEACAALQQCFTDYANCMVNAATTYNNAVEECGSWFSTLKGVGAGAVGGGGICAGIGSIVPGLGTAICGAVGVVVGGVSGGLGFYWNCMRDARLAYENDVAICINNLEACLEQWILTPWEME